MFSVLLLVPVFFFKKKPSKLNMLTNLEIITRNFKILMFLATQQYTSLLFDMHMLFKRYCVKESLLGAAIWSVQTI